MLRITRPGGGRRRAGAWRRAAVGLAAVGALAQGDLTARAGQTPPAEPPPQQPAPQEPQEPEEAPQQPVFRADINFVRVDVIVTDGSGKPITDLTSSDFEVFEDGAPQTVETFRLVEVTGNAAPDGEPARPIRSDAVQEAEAARDDVRLFAIFLDDYHVRPGSSLAVRDPLIDFVTNRLGPLDMVGLMYPLTPVGDIRFSRNRDATARALSTFMGRKYKYEALNQYEAQYSHYPTETVERIRNQVSLSGLKALATHLGGLREGRKAVIVVSEGYSNYLPPQLRSAVAGTFGPDHNNPMRGMNDSLEERAQFFADSDLQVDLRSVYDAANRSNTALYTLDPRGLAAFAHDIDDNVNFQLDQRILQSTQDTLRVLADQTDGRAIVNQNDLAAGLRQVVADSSSYYLLGYNSTQAPADGKFHEIEVKIKRRGVKVRARKGYWALTADDAARITRAESAEAEGPDPGVTRALATIEVPRRARLIRTWIGASRGSGSTARVRFVWEPVPPIPGDRREPAAQVQVMAAGRGGDPYFMGRVPDGASGDVAGASNGGSSSHGSATVVFDAPPGRLQIRLSVEGEAGQVLDSDVTEVDVPDFTAAEVQISTPAVLRGRTVPEFRALTENQHAVPTADRVFRRSDRVIVRFDAYGPGEVAPACTARLLNRGGDPMSDLEVEPMAGTAHTYQVSLPLAGLPAGDYVIEVAAAGGDEQVREFVGIRVGS